MVLKLESTIMQDIGFKDHFSWYHGSSSCARRARDAANEITKVIQKYHDAGELISAPDEDLINLLKKVAEFGETSESSLEKTWQAASYIISKHIHYAGTPEKEKKKPYEDLKEFIKKVYLPPKEELEGIKLDINNPIS